MQTKKQLGYVLSLHIEKGNIESGLVDAKVTFQETGKDEEVVMEKTCSIASVKAMMDGIFKEIYLITQTSKC